VTDPRTIHLLDNEAFIADLRDTEITQAALAARWEISTATSNKWRRRQLERDSGSVPAGEFIRDDFDQDKAGGLKYNVVVDRILPLSFWLDRLRAQGFDPDNFTYSFGNSVWTQHTKDQITKTLHANRFSATLRTTANGTSNEPLWPVIQPGQPVAVRAPRARSFSIGGQWQTAVLCADPQIGFRRFTDGTMDPFHDEAAIDVMLKIVEIERPQQTVVMGDIMDLAAQGRWSQEAGFAETTQAAIDRTTMLGAELRNRTPGELVYIEGNHDKRMQNFVETNALSTFGLKKGGMPESWPVMSMPNLLRLEEFNIKYMDAYPTSHWWVNSQLRCEHGMKVNSSGSTAQKYTAETPHFSRAFGHTHRLEAQSRTTYDRMGKIKSAAINPGCLCRVDGGVPGVHSAIGIEGKPAETWENWQQGVAIIRFKESGEFFWDLAQIEDGVTVYGGQEIRADKPSPKIAS
jgi:predicted phosphodiesterase